MMQVLVIVAMLAMHASAGGSWEAPVALPAWLAAMVVVGPLLLGWGVAHGVCVLSGRAMDRGHGRAALRADRAASWCRGGSCVWIGATALVLGWPGAIGGALGIGYAGLALGALLLAGTLWSSWWSVAPIDRRLRESTLLRRLELGQAVWEIAGAEAFATARLRDGVLMVLLPVLVLIGFSTLLAWAGAAAVRGAESGAGWASWMPGWLRARGSATGLESLLQVAGFVVALALMPMLQRRIWDTVPLGTGPLRESIERLCSLGRTRLRKILVWRTRGLSANAAVLGALPRFRYLIFTDALLEGMPVREVAAVAAHEIGHLRHHHVLWLIAGLGATLLLTGEAGARGVLAMGLGEGWEDVGAVAAALVLGLPVMGFVSRRFEWQADAYATGLLSRAGSDGATSGVITPEASRTVGDALERAALLNGADPRAFSWRHGSIASRRRRVGALAGRETGRLAIDRVANLLKGAIVAAWGVIGWLVLGA